MKFLKAFFLKLFSLITILVGFLWHSLITGHFMLITSAWFFLHVKTGPNKMDISAAMWGFDLLLAAIFFNCAYNGYKQREKTSFQTRVLIAMHKELIKFRLQEELVGFKPEAKE